jgi:hypothetical protein
MGAVELAYQLREQARFMVASQFEVVVESWPYACILGEIRRQPSIGPELLGTRIVEHYISSVRSRCGPDVTLTLLDLSRLGDLAAPLRALAASVSTALDSRAGAVRTAFDSTAFLSARQFLDLPDLCARLGSAGISPEVTAAARQAQRALSEAIRAHGTFGPGAEKLRGMSVYFRHVTGGEDTMFAAAYQSLAFAQDTGWHQLMKRYASASPGTD